MADPISALSIVGAAASLINVSARTVGNLRELQRTYSGATTTLRSIVMECTILEAAVRQIKSWVESMTAAQQAEQGLKNLQKSLEDFVPSMLRLDNEVNRLLGGVGPGEGLGFRARIQYMWNEDVMAEFLNDVRWQASALHFLLTATQLSTQKSMENRVRQFERATTMHYSPQRDDDSLSIHSSSSRRSSALVDPNDVNEPIEQSLDPSEEYVVATRNLLPHNTFRQLSFRRGDIIKVLRKCSDGQWYGENQGRVGYFPIKLCNPKMRGYETPGANTPTTTSSPRSESTSHFQQSGIEMQPAEPPNEDLIDLSPNEDLIGLFWDVSVSTNPFRTMSSPTISQTKDSYSPFPNSGSTNPFFRGPIRSNTSTNIVGSPTAAGGAWPPSDPQMQLPKLANQAVTSSDTTPVTHVRALFDFQSSMPGDLQFRKGDVITVIGKVHKDWWKGSLQGRTGVFPSNYVEKLDNPPPGSSAPSPAVPTRPSQTKPGKFAVELSPSEQEMLSQEEQCALIDISEDRIGIESRVGMYQRTPFLIAARCGSISTINHLCKFFTPNYSARDARRRTALHLAAMSGNAILVQQLLPVEMKAAHAEADAVDVDDVTMLHYAARYGHVAVVSLLLELYGPLAIKKLEATTMSQKYTPFLEAVAGGHLEMIQLLLQYGAKCDVRARDYQTGLHIAVKFGWAKITQYLLGLRLPVNWADVDGCTALHFAAANGSLDSAQYLVNYGAKVGVKNIMGRTPLHEAAEGGSFKVVELLLRKGADKDQAQKNGLKPVELACMKGHIEVLKLLLFPKDSNLALLTACTHNQLQTVEWLANRQDVNVNAPAPKLQKLNSTVLHHVAMTPHVPIAAALIRRGAIVSARDKNLETPLHWAARSGRLEMVRFFLEKGADPQATNKSGQRPGSVEIVGPGGNASGGGGGTADPATKAEIRRLLNSRLKADGLAWA
ncbi:hypothetical protein GP486_005543 [Trichoglossum hirsutum]|uniref:Class E vacuolar protein-sorting machinery protein HSE1 n=1 Tax=Trichoglossum hirsutum TaxID=265104 RepID=A0A9P8L959_9PEZI|nr:hypothetical protein GP486_005543 [Trichoglossum hirsutum]